MAYEVKEQVNFLINEDVSITVNTHLNTLKDGVVVSKAVDRTNFPPTTPIETLPDSIQSIAKLIWTKESIEAYKKLYEV